MYKEESFKPKPITSLASCVIWIADSVALLAFPVKSNCHFDLFIYFYSNSLYFSGKYTV